jgi:hypothetical protein
MHGSSWQPRTGTYYVRRCDQTGGALLLGTLLYKLHCEAAAILACLLDVFRASRLAQSTEFVT